MGQSAELRPPFYYAYKIMWAHLLVGLNITLFFTDQPLVDSIITVNMSSLNMGLIVYGFLVRQYLYFTNAVPYCISVTHLPYALYLTPAYNLLVIVLVVVSIHGVFLREYECFAKEVDNPRSQTLPTWLNASLTSILVLVILIGLHLP